MTSACSPTFSTPTIVAEALVAVPDPLRTSLRAGSPGPVHAVIAAIAGGVTPAAATDPAPDWLRPEQRRPFARALAALRQYNGALLACRTGSGKTYIALAVASAWRAGPVTCVVPAALRRQWDETATRLGIPAIIWSHQRLSRGHAPPEPAGLVIVDESHHFRHPSIARYRHLADYLVGHRALLLSATPVVNRPDDLAHQLRLAIRDDALAADGLPSLHAPPTAARAALGALVIAEAAGAARLPVRRRSRRSFTAVPGLAAIVRALDELELSRRAPIAALIRGGLLQAAASSPDALIGALRRYRGLLRHAADAAVAGRAPARAMLRRCVGRDAGQLVLWPLLATGPEEAELALGDLARLDGLIDEAARLAGSRDPKYERLRALLADGQRTLVFTTAVETVAYLRRRLGSDIGWCTGERAGIGRMPVARSTLLRAFAPGGSGDPSVLITTDVAAEGLDLQRASRVVHYDLPWTSMRLDQREGRAARLGSVHGHVEVVRFDPPDCIERRVRRLAAIARSADAPERAGLELAGTLWRWRDDLAARFGGPSQPGTAAVTTGIRGALVGVVIVGRARNGDGTGSRHADERVLARAALWCDADGGVTSSPAIIHPRLELAMGAVARRAAPGEAAAALDLASGAVGALLRQAQQARWECSGEAAARSAARRLQQMAAAAARRRDASVLARVERVLAVLSGGLTAGEERLVRRGCDHDDTALLDALARLPPATPVPAVVEARLTGLILFGPACDPP